MSYKSTSMASDTVEGTGSAINVLCGFKPRAVWVYNVDGECSLFWNESMSDAAGYKHLSTASGAVAAESSHTHAVGTLANATSLVSSKYDADWNMATKPVIALTHAADPTGGAADGALYAVEASGNSITNVITLQSTNASNASVLGETADGSVGGVAASVRFFVKDSDAPSGVQIYINESSSDRLEFVSPTTSDGYIIMPFEGAAGAPPGFAVAVKVYHSATAATGKPLYFNDNGAADAQLVFTDAGGAGGTIPAADITVIGPSYIGNGSALAGRAAAQTISGSTAAGSSHTHTFTGTAGDAILLSSNGITPLFNGFTIGADTDINVSAETINWVAFK